MTAPVLLDANVLIALTVLEHEHHDAAAQWATGVDRFALCPITQGALVRFLLRIGESGATAGATLAALDAHPRATFWPDDLAYSSVVLTGLTGHRQVTDQYLAELALAHGSVLATFDRALATHRPDATVLLARRG